MSRDFGEPELDRFAGAVARHLGLAFDHSRLAFLGESLEARLRAVRLPARDYLSRLETGSAADLREELRELAAVLTVPETYFFRHPEQIHAFQAGCLDRTGARRQLRALSAGCASGEEPYSLAMAVLERWPDAEPPGVSIVGADFNPVMLAKARAGRYSTWSLRETPDEDQARWFRPSGRELVLDERVRSLVTFEERNLLEDPRGAWPPGCFDAVFCRNVLMYLRLEKARQVVANLTRALRPGGLLFLGSAETLRNLSQDFHLRHTHGTFYYELAEPAARPRSAGVEPAAVEPQVACLSRALDSGVSWIEAIRQASDRVAALVTDSSRLAAPEPRPPAVELALVFQLLREERFGEALALLGQLPRESALDPDLLVLRATLLVHAGRRTEARELAGQLLAADSLNVGAHYVLALCSEHSGERQAAIEHSRSAIHLDPTFSMAHVHLGILAKRAEQREIARGEFSRALDLLPREDASRLLLFGGGFGREALLAFCRAELASCEVHP